MPACIGFYGLDDVPDSDINIRRNMSTLIPSMTIAEFKRLKAAEIKELKSVEVTADGEYLFTAIIPHGDAISSDYGRVHAEYLGVKTNIVGGQDPVRKEADAAVSV